MIEKQQNTKNICKNLNMHIYESGAYLWILTALALIVMNLIKLILISSEVSVFLRKPINTLISYFECWLWFWSAKFDLNPGISLYGKTYQHCHGSSICHREFWPGVVIHAVWPEPSQKLPASQQGNHKENHQTQNKWLNARTRPNRDYTRWDLRLTHTTDSYTCNFQNKNS